MTTTPDTTTDPSELNPPLERCLFQIMINIYGVENLRDGLDTATVSLGRFGLSGFYVKATDPDTGQEWIIHDGDQVVPIAEWEAQYTYDDTDTDEPLEDAVDRMVAAKEADDEQPAE